MTNFLSLPPEDLYILQCCGVQDKFSTFTGRNYKLLTFRIAEGPYSGNVLFRAVIDSEKARWVWESWIESINDEDELIGKHAFSRVKHETYSGSVRAGVGQLFKVPDELLGSYITDAKEGDLR